MHHIRPRSPILRHVHRAAAQHRWAFGAALALALWACKAAEPPSVTVESHETRLCEMKRVNADPIRVPCVTADLDVEGTLITTRAYVGGRQVDESTTGLFWIPIETLPDAKDLERVEVTFKSKDEDDASNPETVTKVEFEIPKDFRATVRERVEEKEAFEARVAAAKEPGLEVYDDGDGFRARNFGKYGGCYGKTYPLKFNDGKGVSVSINKCPDAVTINGAPPPDEGLFLCEDLYTSKTKVSEIGSVDFDVAIEFEGATFEATLSADTGGCVSKILRRSSGFVFPGEGEQTPDQPRALLYLGNVYLPKGVDKDEVTLAEVDWFAKTDYKSRSYDCNYGKVTKKRRETDYLVTLHDRRTGVKLHSKLFRAPRSRCDRKIGVTVNTKDDSVTDVDSGSSKMSTSADGQAIKRWIESFL